MLRSCLVLLLAYAALVAGYAWWLGTMFDPPWLYAGAAVVALIVGGSLGSIYNSRVAARERTLVAAARQGLPWTDGRWTAVAGEIHPVAEPVKAPFSGQDCVLCEYDVATESRVSSNDENTGKPGSDFAGFLMNPCTVRGIAGETRLLGFPNLVGFGERVCTGGEVLQNAREFFTTTQFEDYSGVKLVSVFSAITSAWLDDDGLVRKNIRLGKTKPEDLIPPSTEAQTDVESAAKESAESEIADNLEAHDEDFDEEDFGEDDDDFDDEDLEGLDDRYFPSRMPLLKEKRVKIGEKVCAIGIYSGERRGLVPGGLGADKFIKLIRGTAENVERELRSGAFWKLFGGIVVLILVHAAAYGVMQAARYDSDQMRKRREEAFGIAQHPDGDLGRFVKLIRRGVDVNATDQNGRTLLAASQSPAIQQWLTDHGGVAQVPAEKP